MTELHPILRLLITVLATAVTWICDHFKVPSAGKPFVAFGLSVVVVIALVLTGQIAWAAAYAQAALLAGYLYTGYTVAKVTENAKTGLLLPTGLAAGAAGAAAMTLGGPFWLDPILAIVGGILARLFGKTQSTSK